MLYIFLIVKVCQNTYILEIRNTLKFIITFLGNKLKLNFLVFAALKINKLFYSYVGER